MTEQYQAGPLMEFDSHIAGKNAMVRLYPDRIEWSKTGLMGTGAKVATGVMTGGLSFLATGVRGKKEEEMVLIRSITSVSSKRQGLTKEIVHVHTPAGVIDFRCTSAEAAAFKGQLLQLMRGQ